MSAGLLEAPTARPTPPRGPEPSADTSPVPVLAVLAVVGLVVAAGFAFVGVFAGSLLLLVLPAAVVPVVLSVLLRRAALPVSALTSLLGFLVVAPAIVERSAPSAASLRALQDGLVNGWARVLDTTTPMPQSPDLVAFVPLLTWLAAFLSVELVLRRRVRLLAVLPGSAVLTLGVVFASGSGPASVNVASTVGFVVAAGLLLTGTSASVGPEPRRLLASVAGLALVSGLAAVTTAAGPSRTPYDVRKHRSVSLAESSGRNPLALVPGWTSAPTEPLFTVTTATPQNWRLAVLDRFDGADWTSDARYSPAGLDLYPETASSAGRTSEAHFQLQGLTGSWLPAADRPVRIEGARAAVDRASGALVSIDALRPGLGYTVESRAPVRTPAQLVGAVPADDPAARTLPPGLPVEVRRAATNAVGDAQLPVQKALLLEQYLRTGFKFDAQAPPGHSYAHLRFFLASSQTGTSEQFATAFAVMARSLGLPSRVAVGFTSGSDAGHPGAFTVRSGDVLAWPELEFAGLGWVPFYPTPTQGAKGSQQVPSGQSSEQAALTQQVTQVLNHTAAPPAPVVPPRAEHTGVGWPLALAAGLLLLLAWVVLSIQALRLRNRRRLAAAGAGAQVRAAWRSVLARLADAGFEDTSSLTTSRAALLDVGDDVTRLGRIVDRSLYAEQLVTPADAQAARELERAVTAALAPRIPRSRRAMAAVAVRQP